MAQRIRVGCSLLQTKVLTHPETGVWCNVVYAGGGEPRPVAYHKLLEYDVWTIG